MRQARFYAATSGGVFKSTTGGTSWSAMNNGLGLTQRSVRTVAIDPQTTASLYAGTTQGVFQSPDGGASWAPTGAGISETSIRVVVVDRQSPATVYTGTSGGGVFRSTDRGASWSAFNVGLGNRDVRALALSPSSVCLQAGTFGGGVFDFATQLRRPLRRAVATCDGRRPAVKPLGGGWHARHRLCHDHQPERYGRAVLWHHAPDQRRGDAVVSDDRPQHQRRWSARPTRPRTSPRTGLRPT